MPTYSIYLNNDEVKAVTKIADSQNITFAKAVRMIIYEYAIAKTQ